MTILDRLKVREPETVPLDVQQVLDPIFSAVRVTSATRVRLSVRGGFDVDAATPASPNATDGQDEALMQALWPQLYWHFYAHAPNAAASPADASLLAQSGDPAFVSRLSLANQSVRHWDVGWKIYLLGEHGAAHIRKGDRYRLAGAGTYALTSNHGRPPAVGDEVMLLAHSESALIQPGFHYILGETISSEFDDAELARYYFNVAPDTVDLLVCRLTGALNRYRVPFRMKCANRPEFYRRSDAVVCYVARRYARFVSGVVLASVRDGRVKLHEHVPALTKKLAPGVGAADEPGTGESFGQSRMKLVASGIIDAWRAGSQGRDERLNAVARRFEQSVLRLSRPHLASGNADLFEASNATTIGFGGRE